MLARTITTFMALLCSVAAAQSHQKATAPPKPTVLREPFRTAALKATYATFEIESGASETLYSAERVASQSALREASVLAQSKEETEVLKEIFDMQQAKALGRSVSLAAQDKGLEVSSSLWDKLREELNDPTRQWGY